MLCVNSQFARPNNDVNFNLQIFELKKKYKEDRIDV